MFVGIGHIPYFLTELKAQANVTSLVTFCLESHQNECQMNGAKKELLLKFNKTPFKNILMHKEISQQV